MSKSETMTKDTGTAGEPDALMDKELNAVTGGASARLFQACANGTHMPSAHDGWIEVQSYQWGS